MKLLPLLSLLPLISIAALGAELPFYVGTYTKKNGSQGIYRFKLDTETGAVSGGELAVEATNPSFLALHPNHRYLYAAIESSGGAVASYEIQPDGKLKPLTQESTKG